MDADAGERTSVESGGSGLIRHLFTAIALFAPALIVGYLRLRRADEGRPNR